MKIFLLTRALITLITLLNAAALLWWAPNLLIALPLVVVVSGVLDWLSRTPNSNNQQEQEVVLLSQNLQNNLSELQHEPIAIPPLDDWLAAYTATYSTIYSTTKQQQEQQQEQQQVHSRKDVSMRPAVSEAAVS